MNRTIVLEIFKFSVDLFVVGQLIARYFSVDV